MRAWSEPGIANLRTGDEEGDSFLAQPCALGQKRQGHRESGHSGLGIVSLRISDFAKLQSRNQRFRNPG
eukprot:2489137-Rhodomonas_salina.1